MTKIVALTLLLSQGELLDDVEGKKPPAAVAKTLAVKTAAESKTASVEMPIAGGTDAPAAKTDVPVDQTTNPDANEDPTAEEQDTRPAWIQALDRMTKDGAIGFLRDGGVFMWPILFLGIIAGGVIIERYRSLNMLKSDTTELRERVRTLLENDQTKQALELCEREHGPVAAILATGIRKLHVLTSLGHEPARVEGQVVKAMDDYSVHIVAALERHLPVLATVSSAAPMLGFLGTVAGMITSFADIVIGLDRGENIVKSASEGISVALYTTCFGLIVGIPAFMAFNYFSSVINRFVLEVEESATDLMETVTLNQALNTEVEAAAASSNGDSLKEEAPKVSAS